MKTIQIDPTQLQAATDAIPEGIPILMLNLLKYKEQAYYEEGRDVAPCSGREAYFQRYIPEFLKIATDIKGIQPFLLGHALKGLVGPPDETWDDIGIVEYPNFAAFRAVVESEAYSKHAAHHRLAALEDWRLIVTVKFEV